MDRQIEKQLINFVKNNNKNIENTVQALTMLEEDLNSSWVTPAIWEEYVYSRS